MNWKVFKENDPSTHPDIDCPMLIYWTDGTRKIFYIARWDNEKKEFIRELRAIRFYKGDIFYTYVAYIPYIEKELHPIKCDMLYKTCQHEDDGYCLCGGACQSKCQTTEYSLGMERIWKDF